MQTEVTAKTIEMRTIQTPCRLLFIHIFKTQYYPILIKRFARPKNYFYLTMNSLWRPSKQSVITAISIYHRNYDSLPCRPHQFTIHLSNRNTPNMYYRNTLKSCNTIFNKISSHGSL